MDKTPEGYAAAANKRVDEIVARINPPTPYYQHGGITLYHGDCRKILPQLEPVDLVLTDPPYGIDASSYRQSLPDTKGRLNTREIAGDDSDELAEWLFSWLPEGQAAAVWGANNWPHLLPHKGRWCCWDKRCNEQADKMLGSAFELAWENRRTGFDVMVRVQHGGVVNADRKHAARSHPTQKPVALMQSIIDRYGAWTILDPFAGSGTTGVAAKLEGREAILIELDEKHCETAARRLQQGTLW